MRSKLCGLVLAVVGMVAHAAGNVTVTCGNAAPGIYNNGQPPVLNLTYSSGPNVGTPGLFWFGLLAPDQSSGSVMTDQGWTAYQGGLYPFRYRFDNGLPSSISMTVPFPGGGLTTTAFVGHSVYAGHGAYTSQARQKVADRRTAMNSAKASLVAAGRWQAEFDNDERYIWSLVQKDMVDNNKYGAIFTVPLVNCELPSSSQ